MWELDHKESWAPKNWCFWTVVLEKTLESPLDWKEIQLVHPKGDQSRMFIGRTTAEAEALIHWPPDVRTQLLGKDPDAVMRLEQKGWAKSRGSHVGHWMELDINPVATGVSGRGKYSLRVFMPKESWLDPGSDAGIQSCWLLGALGGTNPSPLPAPMKSLPCLCANPLPPTTSQIFAHTLGLPALESSHRLTQLFTGPAPLGHLCLSEKTTSRGGHFSGFPGPPVTSLHKNLHSL